MDFGVCVSWPTVFKGEIPTIIICTMLNIARRMNELLQLSKSVWKRRLKIDDG